MNKMKTVNIKGKEYVEVNERIKYFRSSENYKGYSLETELINLDNGTVTMRAVIKDVSGRVIATGFAQEKESSSFINKTSFIENCETSAWGRALGNLGIGIDSSIASADEVQNAIENQENTVKPPDNLTDILAGLDGVSDIKNLEKYFKLYDAKIPDIKKQNWYKAINDRKRQLGEIEAKGVF